MKNWTLSVLTCVFLSVGGISFAEESGHDLLTDAINRAKEMNIQTGDLFLWATNEMDSVLVQKFTEGPYSNAGVLSVEADGKILLYLVYPGQGLIRSPIEDYFRNERDSLVSVAVVRYKGTLDSKDVSRRLDQFWLRKDQIEFDRSMALEPGMDYAALLNGRNLYLYCTEFIYRLYEGIMTGPVFFENDFQRVYMQKETFQAVTADSEILEQFKRWVGVQPGEQFQRWLTEHKSQILISPNGMLRGGGFDVLFEKKDKSRFKPWALKLLESSSSDTGLKEVYEKS